MPVLMVATYNEDGTVNVMNAAWGTMQERDTVVLNLTETHKTVKNIKSEVVDAPVVNEFPLCLECKFIEYQSNEYGCGVIGKVVRVTADESVMKGDKPDMALVNAIAFDPYTHGYYRVTERVGEAFKDGRKQIK